MAARKISTTQVATMGTGLAGLMFAHLLAEAGIERPRGHPRVRNDQPVGGQRSSRTACCAKGTARVGPALPQTDALAEAQHSGDVLAANGIFNDALYTDVRPALAQWRESRGLPADPLAAFKASGYQKTINEDRVGGQQAGWGA